jgi:hypothetical protein
VKEKLGRQEKWKVDGWTKASIQVGGNDKYIFKAVLSHSFKMTPPTLSCCVLIMCADMKEMDLRSK